VIDVIPDRPVTTNNSRGSAYLDGKIFRGTPDGRLIALDASTGRILWDNVTAATGPHEAFVSAPIAWQGKVFTGIAGRLMAFDAKNGKQLWSFPTTLGFNAGGGFWTTYSLDPTTGEVFGSVANPFPDFFRDGDVDKQITRYTDSVISVDAARGTLNWSYQAVPRDEHDWDLGPAPMLYSTSKRCEHGGGHRQKWSSVRDRPDEPYPRSWLRPPDPGDDSSK
jgi:alcohol dehydrogenase (cytochrome c)